MDLVPFVTLFPEQAIAETRSVTARRHPRLPDDSYAMVESYCPDPKCDCRRVMIGVLPQSNPRSGFLASISFGFDRDAEMAGPFLDPLNPQSRYAEALLALFQQLIADPAYVARLESHYRQVKQATHSDSVPSSFLSLGRPRAAARKKPKPAAIKNLSIYQLKVTLKGSRPPIWRRILVTGDTTLAELHEVIQVVMGWDSNHLHEFRVGRTHYGEPGEDWGIEVVDESGATLARIAPAAKTKFQYEYDFGDSWQHDILVEKILPPDPSVECPACVTGKRSGPPDDCGGIWGYAELLEVLSDPEDPEYEEQLEWLGENFDPEAFDLEAVNNALKGWNRG